MSGQVQTISADLVSLSGGVLEDEEVIARAFVEVNNSISGLSGDVASMSSDINTISGQVGSNTSAITELTTRMGNVSGMTVMDQTSYDNLNPKQSGWLYIIV